MDYGNHKKSIAFFPGYGTKRLGEKKKSHWFCSRDAKVTNQGPVDPSMVSGNHASSNSRQVGKR